MCNKAVVALLLHGRVKPSDVCFTCTKRVPCTTLNETLKKELLANFLKEKKSDLGYSPCFNLINKFLNLIDERPNKF